MVHACCMHAMHTYPCSYRNTSCSQDELLVFGVLSLLLPFLQAGLCRICLPSATGHDAQSAAISRRLLSAKDAAAYTCPKGTWQPYNPGVLHSAHIFLFMIAIAHVLYACLTMVLCLLRVSGWTMHTMHHDTWQHSWHACSSNLQAHCSHSMLHG